MPFVNIRLYEGHGKERKDELAKRVIEAVHEVCKVPREAVWVVFETFRRPTGTRPGPGTPSVTPRPGAPGPRPRDFRYNGRMASPGFTLTCPCCQARLTLDAELGAVIPTRRLRASARARTSATPSASCSRSPPSARSASVRASRPRPRRAGFWTASSRKDSRRRRTRRTRPSASTTTSSDDEGRRPLAPGSPLDASRAGGRPIRCSAAFSATSAAASTSRSPSCPGTCANRSVSRICSLAQRHRGRHRLVPRSARLAYLTALRRAYRGDRVDVHAIAARVRTGSRPSRRSGGSWSASTRPPLGSTSCASPIAPRSGASSPPSPPGRSSTWSAFPARTRPRWRPSPRAPTWTGTRTWLRAAWASSGRRFTWPTAGARRLGPRAHERRGRAIRQGPSADERPARRPGDLRPGAATSLPTNWRARTRPHGLARSRAHPVGAPLLVELLETALAHMTSRGATPRPFPGASGGCGWPVRGRSSSASPPWAPSRDSPIRWRRADQDLASGGPSLLARSAVTVWSNGLLAADAARLRSLVPVTSGGANRRSLR